MAEMPEGTFERENAAREARELAMYEDFLNRCCDECGMEVADPETAEDCDECGADIDDEWKERQA